MMNCWVGTTVALITQSKVSVNNCQTHMIAMQMGRTMNQDAKKYKVPCKGHLSYQDKIA